MKNTHEMKSEPGNLLQISRLCRLQVVARDDDQGANGQLSYMLSGGNEEGAFSLSASGQLGLTRTVDREARSRYVLLVTAADSGGSGRRRPGPVMRGFDVIVHVTEQLVGEVPTKVPSHVPCV